MSAVSEASAKPWHRRLFLPAYSVADAARYSGAHSQTVAYWFYGGGYRGPALPWKERGKPLSYLQLVEVAFVATFRALGVSLQRIRKAREYVAQVFASEFPFAEFRLQTEGVHVLMDLREVGRDADVGRLVVADESGQMAWRNLVGERFAQFDYEEGLALTWHPAGRHSVVVIDPRVSFGAPTVRGIPTWAISGRWKAGETFEEIADDFRLDTQAIQDALAFEGLKAAA
jgi:uncharacterized protein (DUF433 family)